MYTPAQNGHPNESSRPSVTSTSNSPQPHVPSDSHFNASPHKIHKPRQRIGSVVVPESIARGVRYEADSSRPSPQKLSTFSGEESVPPTSSEFSRPSPFEQAIPYTVGARTLSPDEGIGLQGRDVTSIAQNTGRLQLGMMGVGGYGAGKDEIGWRGDWPSLHKPPHSEGTVSPRAQSSTHGCCSLKHAVDQAQPVASTSCCSCHPARGNRVSATPSHGVTTVSCPSCHTCRSDVQPIRQYYSRISHNGPLMTHKHQPLVYCQHPTILYPYHVDTSQTTLYTIPPSYATANHPLTAQQLAFLQQNPHLYTQTVPQHAPFGIIGQAAPPAEAITTLSPAHNCNCGASCECLGCAAHPFNTTTRSHVQSLGAIIAHGEHDSLSSIHSPPNYDIPLDHPFPVHSMAPILPHFYNPNISSTPTTSTPSAHQPAITTTASTPWSPPPSNAVGGQQIPFLSSEYYTMEIPMDAPGLTVSCTDVSGSCQCGDDCACVGCLTHTGHNGIPLNVPAD